jgi:hypothetical protein
MLSHLCSPMFVTWKHAETNQLRGCIGTTTPCVLADGLRLYAIKSAFHDSRFQPVSLEEFKELTCTVSLLNQYEFCDGWSDWSIGKHGVSIEFKDDSGKTRRALFLPEVMVEHGKEMEKRCRLYFFGRDEPSDGHGAAAQEERLSRKGYRNSLGGKVKRHPIQVPKNVPGRGRILQGSQGAL